MEIIYEPNGKAAEYELAVDLYQGCSHACKYCLSPKDLGKTKEEFHSQNYAIEKALDKLARDAKHLNETRDKRKILLGCGTDPYQTIESGSDSMITRHAVKILKLNNLNFSILTKGGLRIARDFDLLEGYDNVSFGSKICFTKQDDATKWEPNAPELRHRIMAIKEAHEKGIRTWLNLDPVIDPDQAFELIKKLHPYINHWKVGKLNNGESDVERLKFHDEVSALLDSLGAKDDLKKSLKDIKEPKIKNPPKAVSIAGNGDRKSKEAEETGPWTEGDISMREGNCKVLLIAPHGHSSDDIGTYQLARQIADELDCYAVVNKKYRKPGKLKPGEKYEEKYLIDLNILPEIEKSKEAMTNFIGPIEEFREQILKKYDSLFLLHIHGIGNPNRKKVAELLQEFKDNPEDLHLLIGHGQHHDKDKTLITADIEKLVKPLMTGLYKVGVRSTIAPTKAIIDEKGKERWYCGNDKKRLNQKLCEPRDKVQSLQLEFKRKGLRDNQNNREVIAQKFADTLQTFWSIKNSESSTSLPVPAVSKPDMGEIYTNLMAIVSKGFENTMLEAGRYLIDTFYGGDPKVAHADKKKQSLSSLNQYILELREKNPGAPGKSWIYNAVNLLIEHESIKAHSRELFHTYGKLLLSHKVLLFPVEDMSSKERLIEYAAENRPTVREFREIIADSKPDKSRKIESNPSLLKIISSPEKLFTAEMSEFLTPEALKQLPSSKLEKLRTGANESIVRINTNIQLETNHIKRYQELIEAINNTSQQDS